MLMSREAYAEWLMSRDWWDAIYGGYTKEKQLLIALNPDLSPKKAIALASRETGECHGVRIGPSS